MSTSPSWFDQDKFSRLIKKVGPKSPTAHAAAGSGASAKTPLKPLLKEAELPPETPVVVPQTKSTILPSEAQLPPETPAPQPEIKTTTALPPEAQLPTEEEEIPTPAPKAPPIEPPREARLSSRLPKIDLRKPEIKPETVAPPIPPPLHADAGVPIEEETKAKEDDDIPVLPGAVSRPPISVQRMMTSQPLSLGKKAPSTTPMPSKIEPKVEPIRAPEAAGFSIPKAPPISGSVPSSKLPQRTSSLPALKSLFQYEIPGGQGSIPGRPPQVPGEPPALKASSTLPAFTFAKPEPKTPSTTLPPVLDDEEHIPSFAGLADAAHLARIEEELTPENLAAEWEKADGTKTDLERLTKERDDALAESETLLRQLRELRETSPEAKSADAAEIDFITRERDEIRSEYIKLREGFEKLKHEQMRESSAPAESEADSKLKEELEQVRKELAEKASELEEIKLQAGNAPAPETDSELEKELETLREQLAEKDRELSAVKNTSTGLNDVAETLKEEMNGLKAELKKAKDDASVAQRGLALSQKALQETRDALREASEGAGKK